MTAAIATPETTQFSTREVPWMKLGKLIDKPVTAAEAAKLGGIDFAVREEDTYRATKRDGAPPKFSKIPDRKAIVRDDTDEWLATVGRKYPIIQYAEAFDFMDTVSPEYLAAGALRKGRQAFMVVKSPANITPFEDDPHELFAVLRTSHDCSRGLEVMIMPLRHRCMNQLTLRSFSRDIKYRWVITHTGDVKKKMANAQGSMLNLEKYAARYVDTAQRLAEVKVSDATADDILKHVLPDRPQRPQAIERIVTGWHSRPDTIGFDGTGWGLVNAVSEYFEWDRTGGTSESRFLAALQGQTHNAINRTAQRILSRA